MEGENYEEITGHPVSSCLFIVCLRHRRPLPVYWTSMSFYGMVAAERQTGSLEFNLFGKNALNFIGYQALKSDALLTVNGFFGTAFEDVDLGSGILMRHLKPVLRIFTSVSEGFLDLTTRK